MGTDPYTKGPDYWEAGQEHRWWDRSECLRSDPDEIAEMDRVFFAKPSETDLIRQAEVMCKTRCPVRWECLSAALEEEARHPATRFGIRGGLSPSARRYLAEGVVPGYHERVHVIEAALALGVRLGQQPRGTSARTAAANSA